MDIKEIKQIIDLMKRSELTEFEIEEKDLKLRICRNPADSGSPLRGQSQPPFLVDHHTMMPASVHQVATPQPQAQISAPATPSIDEADYIKSPMVGTFYRATSPESPALVEKNSKVESSSVVCIIEAMKVMNEIQAEVSGTVLEILVENGEPVEFGQPLFKIKKS